MEADISLTSLRPGADERFVSLRRELGVSTFGINQLVLEPGQRGRIHRHREQEEVYVVLEGALTLLVEGEPHRLAAGDLARVAPETRRQLANRERERCVLIALGGAREHVGRDGEAFESWEQSSARPPQEIPLPPDVPVD